MRSERKKGLHIFVWIIILISCTTYAGCKLGFGGDESDGSGSDSDSDDDVSFASDIERVSISSVGIQADGDSEEPSISSDGFIVAFISEATNIVPGDTNDAQDVFVHDLDTGITERMSVASAGSQGDDDAFTLSLSSNGSFVAFGSFATNLVAGDTNDVIDVFVHDRDTGITARVSIASAGTQANDESFSPAISSTGVSLRLGPMPRISWQTIPIITAISLYMTGHSG